MNISRNFVLLILLTIPLVANTEERAFGFGTPGTPPQFSFSDDSEHLEDGCEFVEDFVIPGLDSPDTSATHPGSDMRFVHLMIFAAKRNADFALLTKHTLSPPVDSTSALSGRFFKCWP